MAFFFAKTFTKMRFWSILRFSIIVNASCLIVALSAYLKKYFTWATINRIALLLIRKYEIDCARISRKNKKKSIQSKLTISSKKNLFRGKLWFLHVYMTHINILGLDGRRDLFRATSTKIYLSGVYYGATKSNVVFAPNNFLSADECKSRRCLELTSKVVVVIYVVEDKIVVILHYKWHFRTRNNEI
jgi:hypothetical protein